MSAVSGATGRRALVAAALGVAAALLLVFAAGAARAAEHVTASGEYGKEGAPSTGVGSGCRIGYDSVHDNLFLFSEEEIFGLHVSAPGTAAPLGGKFPIGGAGYSGCGDPGLAVDSSGNGNVYVETASPTINGWSQVGSPLPLPWPVNVTGEAGEVCGIATTGDGEVWAANYGQRKINKYSATGTPEGSIGIGVEFCDFAIDGSNGDLYIAPYSSTEPIIRLTAASGYTEKQTFPAAEDYTPGIAVNGKEDKLYVGNNTANIKVYSTETGALLETVETGGEYGTGKGLAVDEKNDTLFATVFSLGVGVIKEYFGYPTPKATTGAPSANEEVSGTASPAGVGPITECFFEYGTTYAYGSKQKCAEATPITGEEEVHATLPGLTVEQTYHYRLVLKNGEPNITGFGKDRTITPHHVNFLQTEPATDVTQRSATLNASFNGTGEDTHYYFEWGQSTAYGNQTAVPPGQDAGATTGHTPLSAAITGLTPGATYHYRVVATNALGTSRGDDVAFVPHELPTIESFSSKNVSETSAEIDATIDPRGFETRYFVEYGPSLSYGSIAPVPSGSLPAGETAQEVAVQLTGLSGVTYHFRVVAENVWGTTRTGDQTFNFYPPACPNATLRQQTGSQYLPDCRAYELVSPAESGGVTLRNAGWLPMPLATNPARFAFGGELGSLPGADASNSLSADTYIATRTNAGWESHYVGVPGSLALGDSQPVANLDGSRYFDFLEGAGFEGVKQPLQNVPFIWDQNGSLLERWPFDWQSIPGANQAEAAWQPSPDFSHLAIASKSTVFAPGGRTVAPGSAYDYDVATHQIHLISLTASGEPIEQVPTNTNSPNEFISFPGISLQFVNFETTEATKGLPATANPGISTDGSHILMSTSSERVTIYTGAEHLPPTRLYMRVNDAITYEVSRGRAVSYIGMTADGEKVFFTSPEQLTPADTDNSVDLYMWSEAGDKLTLVSAGSGGAGNGNACAASWTTNCNVVAVKGTTPTDNAIAAGTGEIYFYSPEQLDGQKGVPGAENLYVYRNGSPQFVATFSSLFPQGQTGPIGRIQVSPDGAHAAFLTGSKLTSYNNKGIEEMYTYDPGSAHVLCASCVPDGEAPQANVVASKAGLFMSDDGRVFFQTTDPLVSQDTNGLEDVYEYVEGRPQLITTGTGTNALLPGGFGGGGNKGEEGLAGVSANGVNVYFAARESLVAQDKNGAFLTFYDARTGGGFPYEPPLAPCEAADECHGEGSSAPPAANLSSAAGLSDRGNAPNPKKHKKHKKHKAKKKKGKHKSAKAGHRDARRGAHGKGRHHA